MGVTIKDIAKLAGVSVSTVSRAMNDTFDVGADTRKRIMQLVEEQGYRPNNMARGLVTQKLYTIGLIVPDISNPFFSEIAVGVEKRARALGYSVIFCNSDNDPEIERESIAMLRGKMVDGLIASLSRESFAELANIEAAGFPLVQLDRSIESTKTASVLVDNQTSGYIATKHLLELGHRRLIHFSGNHATQSAHDRKKGFEKAVREYGLSDNEFAIFEGNFTVESGIRLFGQLLKIDNRPTAIFAASDLQAVGAIAAAFDAGVAIPEEISIIGHDDVPIASLVRPRLTTMAQPKYKLGEIAVNLLVRRLIDGSAQPPENHVLQTELVVRQSTTVPRTY
ncbi:MAG: LacI family DNA-binding transcriptional regulator [Negativicutes bacterium]|jgi:LacI family transcriptional regulator